MDIKKISATFGGTIPMANYANVKVEFAAEADLAAGENPEEAMRELVTVLRAQASEVSANLVKNKVATMTAFELLPSDVKAKLNALFPALLWSSAVKENK